MKINRGLRLVHVLPLLAVLGAGCTLLPERPAVDRDWFLLEIPEAEGAYREQLPVPVELTSVRVAPTFAGKGLVYRLGSYRYESDFYNEWFLNPRDHLEQLLRERWTRENGRVRLVTDARAHTRAHQIDILVTSFHGDLEADGSGMARVGLRVFAQGASGSRLWELERKVPMQSRTPEALVAALSLGMGALFDELEQRLGE